ncbi:TetR/AcrR family transcriptional regulator [Streptomyces sp. H39-S7]|uniref:TetR/AcrR family transcriptional regulator n=1 Tax=Streptomyces sp. H39-S7 TaxID=3004357 RepID=UPI0022AF66BD|nr:TetR family transcriptional regulator [Streptomyces sp. H39-S7]MCZ4123829.1 TetR family transcriptional regulator [Streptomyces sp. H39-S7]
MDENRPGPPSGLRELKKARTRQNISDTAIELFLRRGFDQVPVAEIAAAAEVSKPTLFRYFPAKEDLALHRFADHEGEFARVVRERPADRAPLTALRLHWAAGLDARDPVTGLNDTPGVLAYLAMLYSAPSLVARMTEYSGRDQEALAGALREASSAPDDLVPHLAAAQIIAVRQVLALANSRKLADGRSADEVYPEAVTELDRAFGLLGQGLAARFG